MSQLQVTDGLVDAYGNYLSSYSEMVGLINSEVAHEVQPYGLGGDSYLDEPTPLGDHQADEYLRQIYNFQEETH